MGVDQLVRSPACRGGVGLVQTAHCKCNECWIACNTTSSAAELQTHPRVAAAGMQAVGLLACASWRGGGAQRAAVVPRPATSLARRLCDRIPMVPPP